MLEKVSSSGMVFGLGLGRTLIFSTILGFRQFYVDGLSVGELFFFFQFIQYIRRERNAQTLHNEGR